MQTPHLSLPEYLKKAREERWSTGHFNAGELDHMRAIVEACKELGAPAMIGTSEGERKHLGLVEAVALRDVMRRSYGIPIFLNSDHSKSVEAAIASADAGYDSVHIDLSAKPTPENIAGTRSVVDYCRLKYPGISVEGELGYLRGDSKIHTEKIEIKPEDYTKPEEAASYVNETGVDRLAIVIGNIHGLSIDEPHLDIERVKAIRAVVPETVTLVLHGGSGVPLEEVQAAIAAGIANVHINTDLRVAFINALRKSISEDINEVAMHKLDASAIEAMKAVVKEKLTLFGAVHRI